MTPEVSSGNVLRRPSHGLFITGTDTDVGKTYVAAAIARLCHEAGWRLGVYKPVASGCHDEGSDTSDGRRLWDAAGRPGRLADVCPQVFRAPLAPHLAASAEGREVDERLLVDGLAAWSDCEFVIVEGVGGLLSPISENLYVADLAVKFQLPLIIVAKNKIGVINQTLQTLVAAASLAEAPRVVGVVLNDVCPSCDDASASSNADEIRSRCVAPLLAHVRYDDCSSLANVDWVSLAKR